jgi:hypothetical protein
MNDERRNCVFIFDGKIIKAESARFATNETQIHADEPDEPLVVPERVRGSGRASFTIIYEQESGLGRFINHLLFHHRLQSIRQSIQSWTYALLHRN